MTNIPNTDDLRIIDITEVSPPQTLLQEYPISEQSAQTIDQARKDIHNILIGNDDRLLVIAGPCSIHDPKAAREYADKLRVLHHDLSENLLIVMRVYFEKPRTIIGWKGLINDPDLDESFNINRGLRLARSLLCDITHSGLPASTEFLDLISPQYVADLISWGAIGARTTESQGHRELASGISCPIGLKNGTSGNTQIALDAVEAASKSHIFMSLTKQGHSAIFKTKGNPDCHVILRGGTEGTNYDAQSIEACTQRLKERGLPQKVMVDFSHANSNKDHNLQHAVADSVAQQIQTGSHKIMGVMIESNLHEGNQSLSDIHNLKYGVSITDKCINWEDTEHMLRNVLAPAVAARRQA